VALCLTHAAVGAVVGEALRPAGRRGPVWVLAAVTLANAPDLDFLPGLLAGDPVRWHRGATHTLLAALVVAVAAWGLARWRQSRSPRRWAVLAGTAWASHLLVDWLTVDVVPPYGVPVLWPLVVAHSHAPIALFGEIVVDPRGAREFVASLVAPATLQVWLAELATGVAIGVALVVRRAAEMGLRVPEGSELVDVDLGSER